MKKHIIRLNRQVREGFFQLARSGTRPAQVVAVEPQAGKRFARVKRHRKRADFAQFVRDLLKRYPKADRLHLVMDNLNTHNEKSLIETLGEAAARPLLERIEWHYTPKHASWLNMAEIELSAINKQCLSRRLSSLEQVQSQLSHGSRDRNRKKTKINGTFNRKDAKRVFPELYRK